MCVPTNPYVELFTPKVMILGLRLWDVLSREGRALVHGVNALIKETPESSLTLSAMSGHGKQPQAGIAPPPHHASIWTHT